MEYGTADGILPIDATAHRFFPALPDAHYVEIEGVPHGLLWTHVDGVNDALRTFIDSLDGGDYRRHMTHSHHRKVRTRHESH
ncbi:hypothetical protein F4558_002722 [Micromonospora profundi]|nr:hypothetical protein ADK66_26945 [Micromonospora sp. NRRL B-16802]NJC12896.1 hypothetical protein [Micromonospora profundi]